MFGVQGEAVTFKDSLPPPQPVEMHAIKNQRKTESNK
jgi:hypothetical protein